MRRNCNAICSDGVTNSSLVTYYDLDVIYYSMRLLSIFSVIMVFQSNRDQLIVFLQSDKFDECLTLMTGTCKKNRLAASCILGYLIHENIVLGK